MTTHPPTQPFSSIAFLGGGNMAQAIIKGLLASGYNPQNLWVLEKDAEKAQALINNFGVRAQTQINASLDGCAAWVFAVKPQDLKALCQALSPQYQRAQPTLISIAAGVGLSNIAAWLRPDPLALSHDLPPMVRVMPNTPASVGQAISGAFATPSCSPQARAQTEQLLRAMGKVVWVEEEAQIHAITAISGSGTAYFFYFAQCIGEAAEKLGISPSVAESLARQTLIGAGALVAASSESLITLKEQVTSKGGTTEQALLTFQHQLPDLVSSATQAAYRRSLEMAKLF